MVSAARVPGADAPSPCLAAGGTVAVRSQRARYTLLHRVSLAFCLAPTDKSVLWHVVDFGTFLTAQPALEGALCSSPPPSPAT